MKIGQIVKERYEILQVLGEGGMAFVYDLNQEFENYVNPNSIIYLSKKAHLFSRPNADDILSPICNKLGITILKSEKHIAFIGSSNFSKWGFIMLLTKSISSFLEVILAKLSMYLS